MSYLWFAINSVTAQSFPQKRKQLALQLANIGQYIHTYMYRRSITHSFARHHLLLWHSLTTLLSHHLIVKIAYKCTFLPRLSFSILNTPPPFPTSLRPASPRHIHYHFTSNQSSSPQAVAPLLSSFRKCRQTNSKRQKRDKISETKTSRPTQTATKLKISRAASNAR
jgi:hypothetical protein